MKVSCPHKCYLKGKVSVKRGFYKRKSDARYIQRYYCKGCGITYSAATFSPFKGTKIRRIHHLLEKHFCSTSSMRRAAKNFNIHRITVARKLKLLAKIAREKQREFLEKYKDSPATEVVFDHMETFEHTKLKPVSVFVAVTKGKRKILSIKVAQMPAKGLLVTKSIKKYGKRKDHTYEVMSEEFEKLKLYISATALMESDKNPRYRGLVTTHYPGANYKQYKGRRGCVVGQGELKAGGFDPLFSLNHTCAKIRADVNRFLRRTWCTSKNLEMMQDHLDIYIHYSNRVLTK